MRISGAVSVIVCAVFLVAFSTGPLLHSLIPHAHTGHTHTHAGAGQSESESPVWSSLHAALRHEDKNVFFAILFLITVVASFVTRLDASRLSSVGVSSRIHERWRNRKPIDAITGEWLSNGISPYRRFA